MHRIWLGVVTVVLTGFAMEHAAAYEAIYERTEVDAAEVKRVPATTALQTESGKPYFESDRSLFTDLFDYIRTHDLTMTVPVEADIVVGRMRFLVGAEDIEREVPDTDAVTRVARPARTVASFGMRGGYSREAFEEGRKQLKAWLAQQSGWQAAGPAYMVYWSSPWVPAFLKRSEVHIPVTPVESQAAR